MNFRNLVALATVTIAVGLAVMTFGGTATKAALVTCSVPADHATIQGAVNDLSCTTINVSPGAYPESVTISRTVTLNGAQSGNTVTGRTFGSAGESTVSGQITVQASYVTIDGFSLTNPGQATGILVKTAGDNGLITNNIIDTIGALGLNANTQAIYLERGPDNVDIIKNKINNVTGILTSNGGIFIGDSVSANPSLNILIEGNSITNIKSVNRGGYAIQVNNGASTSAAAIGYTEVEIKDNVIDNVTGGGWAHAIGLEGDTPGVIVTGNCISNVIDLTPSLPEDALAVWFEANPSFGTAEVHQNNFTNVAYGIAVHPALFTTFPAAFVNGENNWWGSASGPGPVGPGTGVKVSPGVDYTPWLIAPALGGACGGVEVTSKDQCKNGGWATVFRANGTAFKNQGDCIQYVNTGK